MIRLEFRVTDDEGKDRTVAVHVNGDPQVIPLDTDGPTALKDVKPGVLMHAEVVYDDGKDWAQFKWSNRGDGTFAIGHARLPS